MPNILQILPRINSGGVERGTIEISQAIIAAGYKSYVISAGGKLLAQLTETGAEHFYMDVASKNPIKIWLNSFKIRKFIEKYDIDIVHARSRIPAWSAYLACKNTKAKFMTTFHGVYSGTSYLKKKYNAIMLKGERIIAVSNFIITHIKEKYGVVDEKRITRIHRGVDLSKFNQSLVDDLKVESYRNKWNLPRDKKIFLMPGRLTDWKGQHYFIEALSKLERDDYYALIIGTASKHQHYKQSLIELIKKYNLENKVAIHDNVSDLHNLFALSDIVISASLRPEAFGRIMPEAGAMGRIIIATNHGGAAETVIDGKTGFLISANDSDEFSNKIKEVLELSAKDIKKIEKSAEKHITENFSIERMQNDTIKIYKELL